MKYSKRINDELKDNKIIIRINSKEKAKFKKMMKNQNMTMSEYLNDIINLKINGTKYYLELEKLKSI